MIIRIDYPVVRQAIVHAVIEVTDSDFKHYWSELFENDPLQNPLYSPNRYEQVSPAQAEISFTDRSFVVVAEHQPVFACSLTVHTDYCGRKCFGYFGLEASTHINRQSMQGASNNFKPEAVELLQHHINRLIDENQPNLLEYLDPVSCGVMSPVTQVLLEKGAKPIVQTAKIIDLTLSEHALKRKLCKSQRCKITWGQRNLVIRVASGEHFSESDAWSLSRLFDAAMATGDSPYSSRESYEQLIRQNKAFLLQGYYANEAAASALFVHTARTCHFVYGFSDFSERPIMSALIWSALQHSKKLGCELFEMGRPARTSASKSDRSKFLNSFGGDSHTRLKVCLAD